MPTESTPWHCGQPMYRDQRDGVDMQRSLCARPRCDAVLSDSTLATMREMAWADDNGIQLPGVTIVNTGTMGGL